MQKISVLLIHPEISRTKYNFKGIIENECLELEYISAVLKEKGHNVCIFDTQVENLSPVFKIKEFNPDVVYVCGRVKQENFMLEYCCEAKKHRSDIITIIGGLHAQLCYERMYADEVDYILTTFDVFKIADIIDMHFFGKTFCMNEFDGICYRENNMWKKNPSLPFDINRLPLPDRSYFYEHPENYRYLSLKHAAWVRTAYGCPYRCSFCHRNKMNSGKYVRREIEAVVEEIKNIRSDNIYIVDDDFLIDKKRIEKFIELIRMNNINKNYICYARSDFISKNENLMAELKSIGLYYVLTGMEATSDNQLTEYNKRINVDNNIRSIEICNRLAINIMGMFIIDENYAPKDFRNLYKWVKKHNLKNVAVSIFTPEMGTKVYEEYKNKLITQNPSHWDYLHLTVKPSKIGVKRYYFNYYKLVIRLFLKAKKDGVYDFIDYGDYIKSFVKNIFKSKRTNDDE